MATSDVDSELIDRFSTALLPCDRGDFRRAAAAALEQIPCAGEGIAYRTLPDVWRGFFRPPEETHHPVGVGSKRPSKLVAGEAIGAPDPREGARSRNQFRALHYLEEVAGYTVYYPRLRDRRIRHGRRVELRPALFPGYAFVLIRLQQWYAARWAPGTLGLIMDGVGPAKVPDTVIDESGCARSTG